MNAAEKELLNLLRQEISNEKKSLIAQVCLCCKTGSGRCN